MTDIKEGSVVRIIGQSVHMTVNAIRSGVCSCVWFDTTGAFHTREFSVELLEPVPYHNDYFKIRKRRRDLFLPGEGD